MKTVYEILGTDDLVKVFAATFFLILGGIIISVIKADFNFKKLIHQTRWLKTFVGLVCSAITMRFLNEYTTIASTDMLYLYAVGLGLGSDLSIRGVMALRKKVAGKILSKDV